MRKFMNVVAMAMVVSVSVVGAAGTMVGCAALTAIMAAVPAVGEIVADGMHIIDMVESGVWAWSKSHPTAQMNEVTAAIQRTRGALAMGDRALAGVEHVTQGQQAAAFQDFVVAYTELMQIVAPMGIVTAQSTDARVMPGDAGLDAGARVGLVAPQLTVPAPMAMRFASQATK